MSDYDSAWKEALEQLFPAFVEFFFPRVHAAVDWPRGYEALDKELQQIVREAAVGRRYADKLFKVWLRDGKEAWILIHVEVQSQRDEDFGERMFVYHYRLYDRYRRPVVSLAVLADDEPEWKPNRFGYNLCGCWIRLRFPMVKLLDYGTNWAALETGTNPFGPLVLAHLKTMETAQDVAARRGWKIRILRGLYEHDLTGDQIRQLYHLVDWLMDLPQDLEKQLYEELSQWEKEKQMPHISTAERIGLQKGEEKGRAEGKAEGIVQGKTEGIVQGKADTLVKILERRCKIKLPTDLDTALRTSTDLARLEHWVELALETTSLEEFRRLGQV